MNELNMSEFRTKQLFEILNSSKRGFECKIIIQEPHCYQIELKLNHRYFYELCGEYIIIKTEFVEYKIHFSCIKSIEVNSY